MVGVIEVAHPVREHPPFSFRSSLEHEPQDTNTLENADSRQVMLIAPPT